MNAFEHPFQNQEAFGPKPYRLLPFRFDRFDDTRYIVSNDVGEYVLLPSEEFHAFANFDLAFNSDAYRRLKSRHFLFDEHSECALDLLALKYRTRYAGLAEFTGLHIFVVTLRCDHSCGYCQVSRKTADKSAFDMRWEDAVEAVNHVFRSPSSHIKIEFQGGEPLLNFELIERIVILAEDVNRKHGKALQFVIASNLASLTDHILEFAREHEIYFSTSLDGPAELHNRNRPRAGETSHRLAVEGIRRIQDALGEPFVSALMTTTPSSLSNVHEIIDEYVRLGMHTIFLRPLSPYGFALRTGLVRKSKPEQWLEFYKRGLEHILDINRRGFFLREEYTSIILQKLTSPRGANYVDLQSPSGIGIGAIVYNYDGHVYASDEGRMLAEMGDQSFRLGKLGENTYDDMMISDALLAPIEASLLESAPMCTDCPFLPVCGADPVYHQATQRDYVGHKMLSSFCQRQMAVVKHVISLLEDDEQAKSVLLGWV